MRVKNNIFGKFVIGLLLLVVSHTYAQNVAINGTGTAPNADAILDLSQNTAGGFLLPYMSTSAGITTPTNSLLYYNSTLNCLEDYYSGCSCWQAAFCPCTVAPAAPTTVSGSSPVCIGTYTYTVTAVTNASSYTWQIINNGAHGTFSNGTTSISGPSLTQPINWTVNGTYTVEVLATNACGSSAYFNTFAVTVSSSAPPNPTITVGPTPICASSLGNTYVASSAGATSYTWTVQGGAGQVGTISSGQGTGTITVTALASAGTGYISVFSNNGCLNSVGTTSLTVNVIAPAAQPASVTGTGPYNINGNYTYTVAAVPNATSYTWTIPAGSGTFSNSTTTITGASTTQAITWTAAGTPTISVTANDGCGASSAAQTLVVTVNACSGTITVANAHGGGDGVTSFTLAVSKANDMVIIACNGDADNGCCKTQFGNVLPTITPPSGGAPTVTSFVYTGNTYFAGIAIYYFVPTVAGAYTISVNESGYYQNDGNHFYSNYAWDLTGFCSAPTGANIDYFSMNNTNVGCGTDPTSISTTLQEAAGSVALGTYCGYWCDATSAVGWTAGFNTYSTNDQGDNNGFCWQNIAAANAGQSITASLTATGHGYALIYMIDVH